MTTSRRRERNRNRARRARRRAERERAHVAAVEVMRAAREERIARLGPFVEMYGEGSQVLVMVDACMRARASALVPVPPFRATLSLGDEHVPIVVTQYDARDP